MSDVDRRITPLAEQQLSLITRRQALAAGISPSAIERRRREGRWIDVRPGVYRIAGAAAPPDQELLAACLAAREQGVASHRAAARVHGIRLADPAPLELSVARGATPRLKGVVVHRSRDLDDDQVVRVGALPVTTPARTLVDLGQVVPWWMVGRALDQMLSRKLLTIDAARLALQCHSRHGRTGCGALRRVLERRGLLVDDAESVLELAFARLCTEHDLPIPEQQLEVVIAGRQRRIDFAYPRHRVAIEVDGYEHHTGVDRFDDDRARANELALAGWTVLRFTWQQVLHRPEWVVSVIRRALTAAA